MRSDRGPVAYRKSNGNGVLGCGKGELYSTDYRGGVVQSSSARGSWGAGVGRCDLRYATSPYGFGFILYVLPFRVGAGLGYGFKREPYKRKSRSVRRELLIGPMHGPMGRQVRCTYTVSTFAPHMRSLHGRSVIYFPGASQYFDSFDSFGDWSGRAKSGLGSCML